MKTRGSGGDDELDNIISLCPYHHDLAQAHVIPLEELHAIMTELYGYSYV
jgi:predicted restriction endonuclease